MLNKSAAWWRGYAAGELELYTGVIPDHDSSDEWEAGYRFFWNAEILNDEANTFTPVKEIQGEFPL